MANQNVLHVLLVAAALLAGCTGTASKLNQVSLGMDKAEVIRVMGAPDSTAGSAGAEYLIYHLAADPDESMFRKGLLPQYYVRLREGRVDSYGRVGDFDSAKDPTLNVNLRTK